MTSKSTSISLFVAISQEEKEKAKHMAKSQGMTFQGWLGQLIKRELASHRQSQEA